MGDRGTAVSPVSGWLMIGGGAALALLTFATWYEVAGVTSTAWDALRRTDVAIFGAGVVVAGCGAWLMFGDVGPEARAVAAIGGAVAAVAAIVVIVRMVSPPGDADLKLGVFLALAAGVLAAVGGVLALSSARPASSPGSGPPPAE